MLTLDPFTQAINLSLIGKWEHLNQIETKLAFVGDFRF